MPRIRGRTSTVTPAPARRTTPKPISELPQRLRAKAKWVDETFGNADGSVGASELAAYKRTYGTDAGHARTIAALQKQLELGDPRPARNVVTPVHPMATTLSARALAQQLVKPGGRGTAADADVVVGELAKLPPLLLDRAVRAGVRVVACRDSVTDHLANLRGVTPRGWPPGSTWDRVPGVYDPASMSVVMATHDGANGARLLPDPGYGHGSFNALFHEFGHALDATKALDVDSRSSSFRQAYEADRTALETANQSYLLQPGDAGPEEAFAEMSARHFAKDATLRTKFPHLAAFFESRESSLTGSPA